MDTFKIQYVDGDKSFKLYNPVDDSAYNWEFNATKYVKVTSTIDNAFRDDDGNRARELYLAYGDINGDSDNDVVLLMKRDEGGYYCEANDDGDTTHCKLGTLNNHDIEYKWAGSNYGKVFFDGSPFIIMSEDVGEIDNTDTWDQLYVDVDFANDKLVSPVSGEDDETEFDYNAAPRDLSGFGYTNGDSVEADFVTLRGTVITDADDDIRTYKVPNEVRRVQMLLKPTSAASNAVNTQTVGPLREGDTATVGDVTIKVTSIDVEATASCTASAEGGTTADMSGVSAVISDGSQTYTTFQAAVPSGTVSDLVVLDSQAPDTGTVVTVGGPAVNSVTAAALEGSDVELSPENPVVVKEVGGKIVVAGWTAEDTVSAAQQFISALQRQ